MKFRIDRRELPYDAFVNDPSWLCPIEDDEKDREEVERNASSENDSGKENVAE